MPGGRDAGVRSRPGLYCGGVNTQVTIVGGGSYQWAPELMADLFGTPALAGMHLVLQDVDPAPLPKMEALAHKLNDALDAKATIADDDRPAVPRSTAPTSSSCASRRAGSAPWRSTWTSRRRHGITQTVGDTVGPGGINRSLRNIPVLVGIGKAMEERCPDAWLFNITNPMTCLTRRVQGDVDQDGGSVPRGRATSAWTWPSRWPEAVRGRHRLGHRDQPLPRAHRPRRRRERRPGGRCATWPTRSGGLALAAPYPGPTGGETRSPSSTSPSGTCSS